MLLTMCLPSEKAEIWLKSPGSKSGRMGVSNVLLRCSGYHRLSPPIILSDRK